VAQVRQTVADALQWVKSELDQSVLRVRQGIEAYLENTKDPLPLQRAVVELHQVRGTLTMVRCEGAALLADEMKQGLQDVLQSPPEVTEPLFEGLLGATLQLTDYLDLLSSGVADNSLVFQPQINELRVARGKPVVSETALFVQHMDFEFVQPVLPDLRHRPAGQAQLAARKFLPVYQTSLLQWIKDLEVELNLKRLGKIAEQITASTRNADVYQMWWLYAAVVEALLSKGQQSSLEIKRLFGQSGQQLKALAEQGEDNGLKVPAELSYSLLYLVGRSAQTGPRVKAVSVTYALEELLPPLSQLEDIRARLRGPNTQLLQKLSDALKEDITSVKDAIDLLVRAGDKAPIQLDETVITVDRIADTLGMLGLDMLQRVVMNQSKLIEQLKDNGSRDEKAWMDVAIALLRVETSLDDALHQQVRRRSTGSVAAPTPPPPSESDISAADLHGGESAVWREALVNIARIKVQVRDYIDNGERTLVAEIARQLNEIAAGFDIQSQQRGAEQARHVKAFVLSSAMDRLRGDSALSNQLADAIVNIEYYLEALQHRQPQADALLDGVATCVSQLKIPEPDAHEPAVTAPTPKPAPQVVATPQEVDPEIREVFLEEATEVLAQMQSDIGRWQQNIEDVEILRDIRRAFHTLKGSGRMVGAQQIGEFGWAHENLLNKCLDGSIPVSSTTLETVQQAVVVLPKLIRDFGEGTVTASVQAQTLIEHAAVAARGEAAAGADTELLRIFRQDAKSRLGEVEQFLAEAARVPGSRSMDPLVIRAFHTLRGSGESVSATKLARLAGMLEHYTESMRTAGRMVDVEEQQLLQDATQAMQGLLDAMTHPSTTEPDLKPLFQRIEQMQAAIPIEAADAASDNELVIIFTDEASEILDQAQDSLRAWAQAPLDVHHSRALKRLFHTLKGSARTAQAPAIGEIAEVLESRIAQYGDTGEPPPAGFLPRLEQVVESVYDLIDRFRNGERTLPVAVLVAMLQPEAMLPAQSSRPQLPPEQPPAVEELMLEMPPPGEPEAALEIEMPEPPAQEPAEPLVMPPVADATAAYDGEQADPELVDIFTGEAQELIDEIDQQLTRWQIDPLGTQPRRELLRGLHTLKGSARMAHVQAMGDLSHELESQIAAIDTGRRQADAPFFAGMRNAVDAMHDMLDRVQRGDPLVEISGVIADLRGAKAPPAAPIPPTPVLPTPVVPDAPIPPLASTPTPITAEPYTPPPVEERIEIPEVAIELPLPVTPPPLTPLPVDTGPWAPALFTGPATGGARGAQSEMARIAVEQLDTMLNEAGEISIYRSRLEQQNTSLQFQLSEMLQTISRIREQVRGLDTEAQAMIIARQQGQAAANPDRYQEEFDPLEMDRFSRLQEMSRSLAESMTDLESVRDVLDELRGQNEMLLLQQARVNSELQQKLMRSLMVPFARQAQRLERIVRQTSQEYGKKARIEFSGTEAELDRNVLERMVPPLEHLLRNSIVHGIETPADRQAAGKPETGAVSVRLSRDGPQLVIDISDDGRGLNLPAIRRKAVQMGLIPDTAVLGEADTIAFIFEPGFSTASELTQVAGRGVGMDVVNAEIKQLGGSIEVRTQTGLGAHFVVRLPLSLAITQALLIHVAEEMYALPMNTIEGIARVNRNDLPKYLGEQGQSFAYGGQDYRVRQMAEMLHLHDINLQEGEKSIPLLLVRAGDRRVALAIDEVLGTSEVVVKAVGLQVSSVVGVSGATILADGRVVVILDVPALAQARLRRVLTAEVRQAPVAEAEEERPLIMVVDDSITMRRVAERTLLRNGFRVSTAKDGMDAMGKLQTEYPAVMLLDIEMPRIDGFELATYMRNSEKLKSVPIIMITSRSGDKHRARAEQIGVERYMIKPYQEDQLIQSIHELLPLKA
jgi:chemosensory pili system protein ChpA (sensor histidine kinase/response regulator)